MYLRELYEDQSNKKIKSSNKKSYFQKNNDQFIDINDFEEQYQQSFKNK